LGNWMPPLALRNDRQKQVRRPLGVVVDFVQRRAAGNDVIGHVFGVGCTADAGGHIGTRYLHADAMAAAEEIGGRENFDGVRGDLAGTDFLLRLAGQRMPRPPRFRTLRVDRAMRCLEPSARQLALGKIARQLAFAFAHRPDRDIGADVLKGDEPVRVVLIDRGEKVEDRWAGDQNICRQRLGEISQPLHRIGLDWRHLHERIGRNRRRRSMA
jgi:hypothetical protein